METTTRDITFNFMNYDTCGPISTDCAEIVGRLTNSQILKLYFGACDYEDDKGTYLHACGGGIFEILSDRPDFDITDYLHKHGREEEYYTKDCKGVFALETVEITINENS